MTCPCYEMPAQMYTNAVYSYYGTRDEFLKVHTVCTFPRISTCIVAYQMLLYHVAMGQKNEIFKMHKKNEKYFFFPSISGLIAAILLPMATIISVLTIQDPIQIVRHWNDRLINQHLEVIPQIYLPITMTKMQTTRLHLLITPL